MSVSKNKLGRKSTVNLDEICDVEHFFKHQFEDDIARIFDESLYPDIELFCGKLTFSTHTCILKARANKFYQKLEKILDVNIEKPIFNELHSFISDIYTNCDLQAQEQEIIKYLKNKFSKLNTEQTSSEALSKKENNTDTEAINPLKIDINREYYALVPIEGSFIEPEIVEQDALYLAFKSIIKSQNKIRFPHSLPLQNCSYNSLDNTNGNEHEINTHLDPNKKTGKGDNTPDSLITDDPSSYSDYVSIAFNSELFPEELMSDPLTMNNKICSSSDSGLEHTDLVESVPTAEDNNRVTNNKSKYLEHSDSNESNEEGRLNKKDILLSSSLSSETGSWDSIFPPKGTEQEICQKFLCMERNTNDESHISQKVKTYEDMENVERKPSSCFIDASNLLDEDQTRYFNIDISKKEPLGNKTTYTTDILDTSLESTTPHNSFCVKEKDNKLLDMNNIVMESQETTEYISEMKDTVPVMNNTSNSTSWIVEMSSEPKSKTKIPSDFTSSKKNENQDSGIGKSGLQFYIDLSKPVCVKPCPISNFNSNINSTIHNHSNTLSEFERIEALCNDPNVSITEIIRIPKKNKFNNEDKNSQEKVKHNAQHSVVHSVPPNSASKDLYVKLSDLDHPVSQSDLFEDARMTRSIPEKSSALNQPNCGSITLFSSFHSENALSLNRLFPNLKNALSKSMPGSLSGRTRSPLRPGMVPSAGETDDANLMSNDSELSSVQSSRSVVDSTSDETSYTASLISNCQSRLGQDLLRMFLEEIAPDVIVEVAGKRIKAHKCILSSRCQYFARMLSGGFVESAGNVIALPSVPFEVIHFVLCHIYSGTFQLPDSIPIIELAAIADMLGLEGLKEAIMYKLKTSYCHNFHTPCAICIVGVVECFPLSSLYGLDDLYLKSLKWITKHFTKVWVTKAFSALPKELLEKCYTEHDVNLSLDNIIDTVYGCGIVVGTLGRNRWADKVVKMCRRLLNSAAHFAGPKLVKVLELTATVHNEADPRGKQTLNDCVTEAIQWTPPQEICRAYAFLSSYIKETRHQHGKPDLISNVKRKPTDNNNLLYTNAPRWRLQCENALVRATPRVINTREYKDLPTELRSRLSELGCIVFGAPPSPSFIPLEEINPSAVTKQVRSPANLDVVRRVDMEHVRNSFVPYKVKPITLSPKPKSEREKKKSPFKVRTTKAQDERTKFNLSRANAESLKPAPRTPSTKSAQLKPGPSKDAKSKTPQKRLIPKVASSSESSRTSPSFMRNTKARQIKAMSQDSLATSSRPRTAEPSTDSLSETQSNKYGTYTKAKHALKGSSESMGSSQHASSGTSKKSKIPCLIRKPDNTQKTRQTQSHVNLATNPTESPKHTNPIVSSESSQITKQKTKLNPSLLSATKSSAAKMVTKIMKDPLKHKKSPKTIKEVPKSSLQRSGTFSKDELTFGDKLINIDKKK